MRKLIFLFALSIYALGYSQNAYMVASTSTGGSTTEYYENRVGAANPVSETSTAGWVGGTMGTFESSTVQAHSGATSINTVSSLDGTLENKYFDQSSAGNTDLPDFSGGETVTVTGWIYAPSGADVRIKMTNSSISATQSITFTADTWTEFTFSGVSVTASGNFYLYTDSGSYTYWDDIRIYSEP